MRWRSHTLVLKTSSLRGDRPSVNYLSCCWSKITISVETSPSQLHALASQNLLAGTPTMPYFVSGSLGLWPQTPWTPSILHRLCSGYCEARLCQNDPCRTSFLLCIQILIILHRQRALSWEPSLQWHLQFSSCRSAKCALSQGTAFHAWWDERRKQWL